MYREEFTLRMKIGIDASRLRYGMTGAGRYAAGLLTPLDAVMPDATFTLFARRDCVAVLPSARWSVRCDRHPVWSYLPTTQWIHHRLGSLVRSDPPDVFWAPYSLLPKRLNEHVPCVISVLDFNHVLVPEMLPPLTRLAHKLWKDSDIRSATKTIAISRGTAERMYDLLGRRPDAIAYPAVPEMPSIVDDESARRIIETMGVRQPFLLTVGSRAPRKNLEGAVSGVALLKARGQLIDYQLVMAGPEAWNKVNRALERTAGADWIKPLGFVSDVTLAALYSLADALVFPSLYEGFGMPVVEARAFGCRVVATDSPELREAGGVDATYVAPTAEGVAAGLTEALKQPKPRRYKPEYDSREAARTMAKVFYRATSATRIR